MFILRRRGASYVGSVIASHKRRGGPPAPTAKKKAVVCAAHIPPESRNVLFVRMHERFESSNDVPSGETVMHRAIYQAVKENGFKPILADSLDAFQDDKSKFSGIHKIVYDSQASDCDLYDKQPLLKCRIVVASYFGEHACRNGHPLSGSDFRGNCQIPYRQYLSPFETSCLTNIGFSPRNEHPRSPPPIERARAGLLLGKHPGVFNSDPWVMKVISELIAANFTLYTSCVPENGVSCDFMPSTVVRMGHMTPEDYTSLMNSFSFMLGSGNPILSPSPIEGLASGVAFLNRIGGAGSIHGYDLGQHTPLALLGPPYVYNVDFSDVEGVVRAANMSTELRFSSFVPAEFTSAVVRARTCAWLSDESPCACARYPRSEHCQMTALVSREFIPHNKLHAYPGPANRPLTVQDP